MAVKMRDSMSRHTPAHTMQSKRETYGPKPAMPKATAKASIMAAKKSRSSKTGGGSSSVRTRKTK